MILVEIGVKMSFRKLTEKYAAVKEIEFPTTRFKSRLDSRVRSESVGVNKDSFWYRFLEKISQSIL